MADSVKHVVEPWSWRVSPEAIFDQVTALACRWEPSPALCLPAAELRTALAQAALSGASWLLNPLVFAVGFNAASEEIRQARDLQLAIWLATHGALAAERLAVPSPLWLWGEDGSFRVEVGTYGVPCLAKKVADPSRERRVLLDIWCHTHRMNVVDSWADACGELPETELAALLEASRLHFKSCAVMAQLLPKCYDWVLEATRVVIPLRGRGDETFNSRSSPDFPGLIEIDLSGGVMEVLEALVHESAHQYLYRAEAAGPLIDPSHDGLHRSPLRKEPRPLRGIFLAWHALAFICLMYREAATKGLYSAQASGGLAELLELLDEAEEVILAQRGSLTPIGDDFYARTAAVATHARQ